VYESVCHVSRSAFASSLSVIAAFVCVAALCWLGCVRAKRTTPPYPPPYPPLLRQRGACGVGVGLWRGVHGCTAWSYVSPRR
jgi:hypothetical protein